jgi:hypothetical protein
MTQLLEAPIETSLPQIDFDELLCETRPTRLKLSEAIRQGAALTRPGLGVWEKQAADGLYACAMGAACYVAAGQRPSYVDSIDTVAHFFPEVTNLVPASVEQIPEYLEYFNTAFFGTGTAKGVASWTLADHIITLNDTLHLDRNRIADLVEALGY